METKACELTIKQVHEGKVVATLARLNVVDRDGDVLKNGLLGGRRHLVAIKPQHKWEHVDLGVAECYESGDTLEAAMEFNLAIPSAKDWFEAIRFRHERGHRQQYSFAFEPTDHERGTHDGKGVRFVKQIEMAECSPVLIGASIGSTTLSVKAFDDLPEPEDDPRELEDLKATGVRIQSLIFPKNKWESAEAVRSWLRSHDYSTELDATGSSWRARQEDPGRFQRLRSFCINPSREASSEECRVMAVGGPMKESRSMNVEQPTAGSVSEVKRIIGVHSTATDERPWNFAIEHRQVKGAMPGGFYRNLFAVQDPGKESQRGNYRYLHHRIDGDGQPGAASVIACSQILHALHKGLIPPDERQGVYAHMAQHLRDAGIEPPTLGDIDSYVYPYDEETKLFLWQVDDILLQTSNIHDWRAKKGMALSQERLEQFERMDQKWSALRLLLSVKGLDRPFDQLLEHMTMEARGEAVADRMEKLAAKAQREAKTEQQEMTESVVARLLPKLH